MYLTRPSRSLPKPPDAVAVAPRFAFNRDRARQALSALAPSVAVEPVDARLDLRAHQRIEDRPGRELDLEATLAAVASGPREEGASLLRRALARVVKQLLDTAPVRPAPL